MGSTIESGLESFIKQLQKELVNKTYHPQAVRRVWIPKPDGSKRALGIPTIKDRVAQTAVKMVIEPIFEADFQDCSYGFRPKRSAQQAVKEVGKYLNWGLVNVIDADYDNEGIVNCIKKAISKEFNDFLESECTNPYGDGLSSERILNLLLTMNLDEKLLVKEITY